MKTTLRLLIATLALAFTGCASSLNSHLASLSGATFGTITESRSGFLGSGSFNAVDIKTVSGSTSIGSATLQEAYPPFYNIYVQVTGVTLTATGSNSATAGK